MEIILHKDFKKNLKILQKTLSQAMGVNLPLIKKKILAKEYSLAIEFLLRAGVSLLAFGVVLCSSLHKCNIEQLKLTFTLYQHCWLEVLGCALMYSNTFFKDPQHETSYYTSFYFRNSASPDRLAGSQPRIFRAFYRCSFCQFHYGLCCQL